jgi:hypothetical protein
VANGIVTATKAVPAPGADRDPPHGHERGEAVKILQDNGISAMNDMDEAVQKAVAAGDGRPREHLHREGHQAGGAGHHRPRRLVPRPQMIDYGTNGRGRRDAGEGRQKFEKRAVFNTVADAVRPRPGRTRR